MFDKCPFDIKSIREQLSVPMGLTDVDVSRRQLPRRPKMDSDELSLRHTSRV